MSGVVSLYSLSFSAFLPSIHFVINFFLVGEGLAVVIETEDLLMLFGDLFYSFTGEWHEICLKMVAFLSTFSCSTYAFTFLPVRTRFILSSWLNPSPFFFFRLANINLDFSFWGLELEAAPQFLNIAFSHHYLL